MALHNHSCGICVINIRSQGPADYVLLGSSQTAWKTLPMYFCMLRLELPSGVFSCELLILNL
jgi:hypothetical protein